MTESSKVDHKIFLIMGNSHSGQKVSGNSFSLTATEAELFDFSDCKYSKSLNIVILTGFFSVNEDSEDDGGYSSIPGLGKDRYLIHNVIHSHFYQFLKRSEKETKFVNRILG